MEISDMNDNVIYDTNKYLTKEGAKTMKNRIIKKDSILLSFKLSIGKLAIANI